MGLFKHGKLTFCLDGSAGSSAKGLRAAHIWKKFKDQRTTFVVNSFMSNAAHTITHADGREVIHQCLASITTLDTYQKQYLSPGCAWSKDEIINEIESLEVNKHKIGIHPNAVIVTQKDIDYEKGLVNFDGDLKSDREVVNLRIGSTLHGVGAARARRVLRRPDCVLAKDVPELKSMLCQTNEEIMDRLQSGEAGLGEIAQGWQLSLMSQFYPKCTSRNCSVSAFLDDSILPPSIVGPVVMNFRTFPIRVNNNKYVRISDGKILTWDEWNETPEVDRRLIAGDSGAGYADQVETSWDEISRSAGDKIFETTSLTKLPRRCYTFSKLNLMESLRFNNTGNEVYISVNFMNYVDASVKGKRTISEVMTDKVMSWLKENVWSADLQKFYRDNVINVQGLFIGTWRTIDDSIFLTRTEMDEILK